MHTCTGCGATLALDAFNFRDRARGTRQYRCRSCTRRAIREHYAANKAYYVAKARARAPAHLARLQGALMRYLQAHPCVDCGESDPIVLDFDHREPSLKRAEIGRLLSTRHGWRTIEAEIAKCDVRCANCHRRRTANQFRWYRAGESRGQAPVAQRIERQSSELKVGSSNLSGRASSAALTATCLALLLRLRRGVPSVTATAVLAVLAALAATLLAPTALVRAQAVPTCPAPTPVPVPQMLLLIAALGATTGQPLECVHANPATADLLQQTTTGLLIYRATTGAAIFTDGHAHWALTAEGLSGWLGSGLDPPWLALSVVSGGPPGGPAAVVAHTRPQATCSIEYRTPGGAPSRASGLTPQQADGAGAVGWTWRLGQSTRRGAGQVTVTCDGASATEALMVD